VGIVALVVQTTSECRDIGLRAITVVADDSFDPAGTSPLFQNGDQGDSRCTDRRKRGEDKEQRESSASFFQLLERKLHSVHARHPSRIDCEAFQHEARQVFTSCRVSSRRGYRSDHVRFACQKSPDDS